MSVSHQKALVLLTIFSKMYCKGSGSQSWADVSSSSPTYSNVDVDAAYVSQETDNQYGFWFDGSQTQSNFDPSSQNNYFDYYQGQGWSKEFI